MFNDYQDKAARSSGLAKAAPSVSDERRAAMAAMGLAGEAGEVVDYLKKVLYHGKPLNREKLKDELGDVLWYLSEVYSTFSIRLEDVAVGNIEKLRKRYPNGFTAADSEARVDVNAAE